MYVANPPSDTADAPGPRSQVVRGIVHFGAVVVVSAGTEDEILQELSAVGDDADVSAANGPDGTGGPRRAGTGGIPLSLRHQVRKQECTILAQVPWPATPA